MYSTDIKLEPIEIETKTRTRKLRYSWSRILSSNNCTPNIIPFRSSYRMETIINIFKNKK